MPQNIFHIIAEYPEIEHIAKQMNPPTVNKHRRKDGEGLRHDILGFDINREEVSGTRFWGWAHDQYGAAEAFLNAFLSRTIAPWFSWKHQEKTGPQTDCP